MTVEPPNTTAPNADALAEALTRFEEAQAEVRALLGASAPAESSQPLGATPSTSEAPSPPINEIDGATAWRQYRHGVTPWQEYRNRSRRR
ncbi:hypothetical protein GCM10027403_14500 [Arthrobacter tecti]